MFWVGRLDCSCTFGSVDLLEVEGCEEVGGDHVWRLHRQLVGALALSKRRLQEDDGFQMIEQAAYDSIYIIDGPKV